jgi:Uncharacterized protein conserved in bacteria (DUF2252)
MEKQAGPSPGVETADHSQPAGTGPVRETRKAAGKALRDRCPRRVHATWKPHAERRDPIELLIESAADRMPQLLPIRYGRMMQSPFVFYRGAAAIMAADLEHTPVTGITVQACGDCHLLNFERDHKALLKAIQDGRIQALQE